MNTTIAKQIIEDKLNGITDAEIGSKYNVNLKFIEKAIIQHTGTNISSPSLKNDIVKRLNPKNFIPENNSVWSFKSRGDWATHNGNYRGNWSPYIPRNVILKYSNEGDTVLDYFCGAGTTAIECKLLNRSFKGFDINKSAVELTELNLNFEVDNTLNFHTDISVSTGDARNLPIDNDSIDIICAHPPYSNIINYTNGEAGDLSGLEVEEFLKGINKVAKESYRVLRDGKYCAILIGDMRKNKNVIPLGFLVAEKFLDNGFYIEEMVIKRQHNCKTTGFWYKNSIKYNFLLLAHEYLFIFKKQKNKRCNSFNISEKFQDNNWPKLKKEYIKKDIVLEAKTVWILNSSSWFGDAVSNLVLRYSNNNYLNLKNNFILNSTKKKKYDLIIFSAKKHPEEDIKNLSQYLNYKGVLAVFCQDSRLKSGMIYQPALEIEKKLRNDKSLKIKEIIVLALNSENNDNIVNTIPDKFLKINHKYILLYMKN